MPIGSDINLIIRAINYASEVLGKIDSDIQSSEAKTEGANQRQSLSWMDVQAKINLVQQGVELLGQAYDATIGETTRYFDQVRELSMISGQSIEETARFIQVLDDYKISADDALIATRALTKEGYAPTIETLAELSDKYLALNSAEERNEFILKNLGRGGLQWVDILNKGSEAILQQGAAVEKGLIPSQKQADAAKLNALALDRWNDSINALKYSISNEFIPILTDAVNAENDHIRALEIMKEQGLSTYHAMSQVGYTAALAQAKAEREAADATMLHSEATLDLSENLREEKERLEAVSKANQGLLGLIRSLGDENKNYQKTLDETIAKYGEESEQVKQLQADHQAATNMILYDLELQKLAVGGLTDSEFKLALQMGETLGIFDEASVKMATDFDKVAQALADGTLNVNDLQAALERIAEGKDIEGWNLFTVLRPGGGGEQGPGPGVQRDSGGRGMPGGMYVITPQASPEMFIPDSPGTFIPNADRALGGRGGDMIAVKVDLNYSPTFSFASRAEIEGMMPVLEEGVRRVLKNLGK